MITPNKIIPLESSAMARMCPILELGRAPIELVQLYRKVSKHFESVDSFLLTIDLLYVLGRIDINFKTGILNYVD